MQNKSEVSSPKIHEFGALFNDKVKDPGVSRTWFYSTLEQGSLSRLIFVKGQLADILVFAGHMISGDFPVTQTVKNPPTMQETEVQFLGQEDPPEKGMAAHYRVLVWRIRQTGEPSGLQSMGLQRVEQD